MAMFSKEHGVVAGILVLADDWLQPPGARHYPVGFYITTVAFAVYVLARAVRAVVDHPTLLRPHIGASGEAG